MQIFEVFLKLFKIQRSSNVFRKIFHRFCSRLKNRRWTCQTLVNTSLWDLFRWYFKYHLYLKIYHPHVQTPLATTVQVSLQIAIKSLTFNLKSDVYLQVFKNYHEDLKKQEDLRKCTILTAVTLLWHVALVSLVRHHSTSSLLNKS